PGELGRSRRLGVRRRARPQGVVVAPAALGRQLVEKEIVFVEEDPQPPRRGGDRPQLVALVVPHGNLVLLAPLLRPPVAALRQPPPQRSDDLPCLRLVL